MEQLQGVLHDRGSQRGKSANWFEITLEEAVHTIHTALIAPDCTDVTELPAKYNFGAKARLRMRNLKRTLEARRMATSDTLYIMQNTRIPNEVKIGRSWDVMKRR